MSETTLKMTTDTKAVKAAMRKRMAFAFLPIAMAEEAENGRVRIVALTARSKLAGAHMADQWFVRTISKKNTRPIIEITHPANVVGALHPSRTNSDGSRVVVNDGDHNLLATLEWGSKAHWITANNAFGPRGRGRARSGLTFKSTKGARKGEWVTVQSVWHPGTRAFGMARIVSREIKRDVPNRVLELMTGKKTRIRR